MEMEKEIQNLNLDDILPNRFQPRIQFSDKNINELAESIKEHGIIQPIVVRKISDKYEIIAGERRYKASVLAGKNTIPAIVTNLDDKNSAEIALLENVQRQDLTPIEEAVSYKKILDMGYINQTSLADKLGKTQSTIANKLRLLNLHDDVQEALLDGKISERHARSLLKMDGQEQVNMLNRIISERLTVRQTDEEINKLTNVKDIKESEGVKMDDKVINDFNIPTSPIVEDMKDTVPVEPIIEYHEQDINPGFMDIDKIENNAEDLFKPEELANMDQILEKPQVVEDINPMAPVMPVEPINDNVNNEPSGGRFFSMFNFNRPDDNPNFVSDIENKETNLNFGEQINNIPPAFNPFEIQPDIQNNEFKPEESFNFGNLDFMGNNEIQMNNYPDFDSQNNMENNELKANEPLNFGNSDFMGNNEIQMNNYPDFDSQNNMENNELKANEPLNFGNSDFMGNNEVQVNNYIDFDNQNNSTQDNYNNLSNINFESQFEINDLNQNIELANNKEEGLEQPFVQFNPYHLNDESDFTTKIPVITEDMFNDNVGSVQEIEEPSFTEINNNINIDNLSDQSSISVESMYGEANTIEEKVQEPFIGIETTKYVSDFKMVINTIRNCAETIEKYGYKIDTEEIDLENQYQVIFKIEKK